MESTTRLKMFGLALTAVGTLALPAQADLIVNGGFEAGLTSWTTADQIGSEGTFTVQTGTLSPLNGFPVPAPPEGLTAAMTDAFGPGSHVLYQDFVVPLNVPAASISFSLFVNNTAGSVFLPSPEHLDFSTPDLNQQARVDILTTSADPFSLGAGDILQNLYGPADPLLAGYNDFSINITALLQAHAGETLRLRFAEVDNVAPFNLGVDNVGLNVIPEPGSWALVSGLLCLGIGCLRRVRRTC